MPYNGSGTFNRLYSWAVDAANNVNISSSRTDAELNGIAAALTNCVTRDGQSPPATDLPMGGKKLTNLGLATTATDALSQAAGDARYLLQSITTLTLSGSLTAGSISTGGTLGVTGLATLSGGANVTGSVNATGNIALTANGTSFLWTDANGGHPSLGCDGSNNLTLNGTDAGGASRTIFSVGMHSGSSAFNFAIAVTAPTPSGGDNSTKLATTAFVAGAITTALGSYAPLASPALTGTPTAPTAAADTATTQLATTAFVDRLKDLPRTTSGLARGKVFATAAGVTVNSSNASEAYSVYNDSASAITLTQGAGVTLRLHGTTTTGDRTLAPRGFATLWYNGSAEVIALGDVT